MKWIWRASASVFERGEMSEEGVEGIEREKRRKREKKKKQKKKKEWFDAMQMRCDEMYFLMQ